MTVRPETAPLAALADVLARHRVVLFVVYAGLVLLYTWLVYHISIIGVPAAIDYLVPGRDASEVSDWSGDYPAEVIGILSTLLVLQALFLFGGGRIPVRGHEAGRWRTYLPIAVAGAVAVVLLTSFAFTLAEMFDRASGEGSIRETAILDIDLLDTESELLTVMLAMWAIWLVVAVILFRKSSQETIVRKLTVGLLAGSWIEFLVALPVDIAIRQRADACVCATGSWIGLSMAIPVMLFAFGPALYLLYLREVDLGRTEPGRAMRIVVHKSRRERARQRTADGRTGDE